MKIPRKSMNIHEDEWKSSEIYGKPWKSDMFRCVSTDQKRLRSRGKARIAPVPPRAPSHRHFGRSGSTPSSPYHVCTSCAHQRCHKEIHHTSHIQYIYCIFIRSIYHIYHTVYCIFIRHIYSETWLFSCIYTNIYK